MLPESHILLGGQIDARLFVELCNAIDAKYPDICIQQVGSQWVFDVSAWEAEQLSQSAAPAPSPVGGRGSSKGDQ